MVKGYKVYVDDNFHYMDESERYKLGEFDDCQSAVAACKGIVDEFLSSCDPNKGADEMFKQYTIFGEIPGSAAMSLIANSRPGSTREHVAISSLKSLRTDSNKVKTLPLMMG